MWLSPRCLPAERQACLRLRLCANLPLTCLLDVDRADVRQDASLLEDGVQVVVERMRLAHEQLVEQRVHDDLDLDVEIDRAKRMAEGVHQMVRPGQDLVILELLAVVDDRKPLAQRVEFGEIVCIGLDDDVLGRDRLLHLVGGDQAQFIVDVLHVDTRWRRVAEVLEALLDLGQEAARYLVATTVEMRDCLEKSSLYRIRFRPLGEVQQCGAGTFKQLV
jgi:hypothetical protein